MADPVALRTLSAVLLGNKYRIEIGAAICDADGDAFTSMSVHSDTNIFYQRVNEDLGRLQKAGLIIEATDASDSRSKQYKAVPTIYWSMCKELRAEWERGSEAPPRKRGTKK